MQADIRDVNLERYYPPVVNNAKEFKAIANVENPEFIKVWKVIYKQFLNTFVYSLDEDGATRWENMLKLHIDKTDTLATRQKRILAKINSSLPYTERSLQNMFDSTYGVNNTKISIKYDKYALWVDSVASLLFKTANMRTFLRAIIPTNMTVNVSNTKIANLNEYCGATMQKFKHITIHPSVAFKVENSPIATYAYGGGVKRMTHITLRS